MVEAPPDGDGDVEAMVGYLEGQIALVLQIGPTVHLEPQMGIR